MKYLEIWLVFSVIFSFSLDAGKKGGKNVYTKKKQAALDTYEGKELMEMSREEVRIEVRKETNRGSIIMSEETVSFFVYKMCDPNPVEAICLLRLFNVLNRKCIKSFILDGEMLIKMLESVEKKKDKLRFSEGKILKKAVRDSLHYYRVPYLLYWRRYKRLANPKVQGKWINVKCPTSGGIKKKKNPYHYICQSRDVERLNRIYHNSGDDPVNVLHKEEKRLCECFARLSTFFEGSEKE